MLKVKPLKAELHAHTWYSMGEKIKVEGIHSPEQLVRHASRVGLDVLAITDHNVFNGAIEAEKVAKKYGIVVIKGEEIETAEGKHVIGLGLSEYIAPRKTFWETLDTIREQGGIAIAPHPFDIDNKGVGKKALACDAIEVFNAINKDRFSNIRAKRLAKKKNVPMVAGSDAHCVEMLGYGKTEIISEADTESVLKAIKDGKTKVMGKYVPVRIIKDWSLKRVNYSYIALTHYIYENYGLPKRLISKKLLQLARKSPKKADFLFSAIAYAGLFGATIYSAFKTPLRK
ncbi:MAG: PHP domain-containing protein [Candidatus Diapherotrites archaeon]|nr:PHP domain-containing protein [Candidatus Diapherotrites archaeon]